MPRPPYIDRAEEALDLERYQTVYARIPGAVAATTAGLHFDERVLEKLDAKGIRRAECTLHVGAGTFQPVREENVHDHQMHAEWLEESAQPRHPARQTRPGSRRAVAGRAPAPRGRATRSARGM